MTDEEAWMHKHLGQLVGWTVDHPLTIRTIDEDEPMYGLILTRKDDKKHQMFVIIQCDPEGNGPGFLHISKERHGR